MQREPELLRRAKQLGHILVVFISLGVYQDRNIFADVSTRQWKYNGGMEVKLHEILIMIVDINERTKVCFFLGCNTKLLSLSLSNLKFISQIS
jgi:hypothetical protein